MSTNTPLLLLLMVVHHHLHPTPPALSVHPGQTRTGTRGRWARGGISYRAVDD